MVTGARRMLGATIKRQPINQQKRKCTRADPTQTGILLKNYDAEARPSAERLADMSQETNLCAALIAFTALTDISVGCLVCFPPTAMQTRRLDQKVVLTEEKDRWQE